MGLDQRPPRNRIFAAIMRRWYRREITLLEALVDLLLNIKYKMRD